MTIKKLLLLASMAFVAVALAAPAAQAELTWSEGGTFEVTGNITSASSGLVTGPAAVHIHGGLFNAGGMGGGFIDSMVVVTGVVPTNLPGCHAAMTSSATWETTWPITLTTDDTIDIGDEEEPVTYTMHYTDANGPGCPAFKVPAKVPVEGVITATITNDGNGNACIGLSNYADDLVNELSGGAVDATSPSGPLCISGVEVE